jgi:hypothetical protein
LTTPIFAQTGLYAETDLSIGDLRSRASFWLKCTAPFIWGVYEFSGGAALAATPFRIIDKSIGAFP